MSKAATKKTKCIAPGCNRPVHCRGLCNACYFVARREIKSGHVPSWDYLVDLGLAVQKCSTPIGKAIRRVQRRKRKAAAR